ncbi:MAG: dihydrolipoamide acetyltransferase family protein, partial [Desulfobacterales bacterium]
VPASPATRRLARELGVELAQVPASGPAGLVTGEDVGNYASTRGLKPEPSRRKARKTTASAPLEADDSRDSPERIAYKSVRRAIGKQMARAWAEIPHVTTQDEVDITRLELLRRRQAPWVKAQGGHLSLTVLMVKAAIRALKTYPNFNAQLDLEGGPEDDGAILRHRQYHIGIAVDTPDGLIVPVVRHGDRPNIVELSRILSDLVARTRARKVSLQELQGGTFTITNVGRTGGAFFTPIINSPQVAILGMGGARIRPVMVKTSSGEFKTVPRLLLPLTLTIDHRVLDGADAGRFLYLLKEMLQEPEKLLLLI